MSHLVSCPTVMAYQDSLLDLRKYFLKRSIQYYEFDNDLLLVLGEDLNF